MMETQSLMLAFALGPLLWIGLAVWWAVRQVSGPRLGLGYCVAAVGVQGALIALPFVFHHLSVIEAGLSGFSGCSNGREYCEEFYHLEFLRDRRLVHLGAASWVGTAIWILVLLAGSRLRARTSSVSRI